jgi:hypothetical protein
LSIKNAYRRRTSGKETFSTHLPTISSYFIPKGGPHRVFALKLPQAAESGGDDWRRRRGGSPWDGHQVK